MTLEYTKAGVNIDAGNKFIDLIKPIVKSTKQRGVLTGIGGYGGLFAPDLSEIKDPVLVPGTDGVGTKLKLAIELGKLDTIGIDLVAMCVNDIACTGAKPLFFLDYFATGKLRPTEHTTLIKGNADACKKTKCALIGGETAEMPDLYKDEDFDLAGFAVGIVDRNSIIDGSEITKNDAIIGVTSSGFHSNGFALIRKIIKTAKLDLKSKHDKLDRPLGQALLTPTRLYSPMITGLVREFKIKGMAHITGGGFIDNIPRILPTSVQAVINRKAWTIPSVMNLIQRYGSIGDEEMFRVFNCGIGLIMVVAQKDVEEIVSAITAHGEGAYHIGFTRSRKKGAPQVYIKEG